MYLCIIIIITKKKRPEVQKYNASKTKPNLARCATYGDLYKVTLDKYGRISAQKPNVHFTLRCSY